MATKIVTKNSSTASAVPTASDLVQGELAVNVADKRLFTEDNGGSIVELGTNPSSLTVTGEITANGGIALGDSDKATFGASDDLQIYHNGNNSFIEDAGTGSLYVRASSDFRVQSYSDNKEMIRATANGAVSLYHNNSTKLATTATGIDVNGTATMDGLTVDGTATFNAGNENVVATFTSTDTEAQINLVDSTGSAQIRSRNDLRFFVNGGSTRAMDIGSGGDISFYEDTGTTPKLFWDASAERLGLTGSDYQFYIQQGSNQPWYYRAVSDGSYRLHLNGTGDVLTADSTGLDVNGTATLQTATNEEDALLIKQSDGTDVGALRINNGSFLLKGKSASQPVQIQSHDGNEDIEIDPDGFIKFETAGSERLRIDSSGNVGIGTSSNFGKLSVNVSSDAPATSGNMGNGLTVHNTDGGRAIQLGVNESGGYTFINSAYVNSAGNSQPMAFFTGGSERMRIDSSGNLLVGKDGSNSGTAGHELLDYGRAVHTVNASTVQILNRLSNDGTHLLFEKDGTSVGSIGTLSGDLYIGTGDTTLKFEDGADRIVPRGTDGAQRDGTISLGSAGNRFDDIYATNGTIQTSDAREKTEVREFTDAEMRVAKKLSKNIGFFQWLASVEEKGDDARMHCGQTVQSVIAEFEAEGLDAFDYAMICYNEWDAETVEHPAVEAVEAVDAVYDEEGELISEAIEAVEAADAWTETTQEAGDRYSLRTDQLNHFMVKGLAQAQEELEARIAALEA